MSIGSEKRFKLYIATEHYPFGNAEDSFLETEIHELSKVFDICILSHEKVKNTERGEGSTLKKNICACNLNIELPLHKKVFYAFSFLFDGDGWSEIYSILKSHTSIIYRIYQSIGFYALAMENYRLMKKANLFNEEDTIIYYSYWFYYYTYSMTKFRKKYPNIQIVTRTHGFDLYDERYNGERQPFKRIMDKNLDKVIFISNQGKQYYQKKYNLNTTDKYIVNKIGTRLLRPVAYTTEDRRTEGFRLVSCSSMIPIKRVHLIIQALGLLDEPIEWIHFGDGEESSSLQNLATGLLDSKKNISYEFKGWVTNEDVLDFYGQNYISCFISTSSTEGLPVSMQEAMAFGIPLIATNVGGVPELFKHNGILLDSNPTEQEISEAIKSMIKMKSDLYCQFRANSNSLWKTQYNAEINSKEFTQLLKELSQQ